MARAIDASELMVEIQACSWDSEQDKERAEDLVLGMPTLPPPNELLTLEALREMVERTRGEWVKRHKHRGGFRRVKGIDDMGEQHEVEIDERCEYDDLYCSECGKQSPDNFLNFCAYCGAPMTDEAVQMVMERMEKMNGESE